MMGNHPNMGQHFLGIAIYNFPRRMRSMRYTALWQHPMVEDGRDHYWKVFTPAPLKCVGINVNCQISRCFYACLLNGYTFSIIQTKYDEINKYWAE